MQNINILKFKRLYRHLFHQYGTLNNVVIGVGILLALSWAWSAVGVMETNYRLQQQLDLDQQQLSLAQLQVENLQLQQRYYQTNEYKELSVRQHLGLGLPGEKLLILPPNSQAAIDAGKPVVSAGKAPQKKNNFEQWIDFFNGHRPQS